MTSFLRYLSLAGATLFEIAADGAITTAGALSAVGGTFSGAVAAASASVTGALSVGGLATITPQTIDMADGAIELVYGIAAGAGQVVVANSRLNVDPNSGGAGEDLTIDTTATGLVLAINNTGGENIVVKSNGGSTLGTIPTAKAGLFIAGIMFVSA